MDDKLTPRAKRLLVIMVVTPFLFLAVFFGAPMLNPQMRNLAAVRRHIDKIDPHWLEFKTNPDFEFVELFAWTGSNGLFGVYGELPTEESLHELKEFMQQTDPPRPIYLGAVRVWDQELFEEMRTLRKSEQEN
jgi:hypothetical protein